jgi:hypothetical protein
MNPENIIQQDSGVSYETYSIPESYVLINRYDSSASKDSNQFQFPVKNVNPTLNLTNSPLFISHELKPHYIKPRLIEKTNFDWIFLLLTLCFIILAWVQVFFRKRFIQILQSFYSEKRVNFLIRDGNLFSEQIALALGFVYIVCFSLLLFFVSNYVFRISLGNSLFFFLKILAGYALFILLKFLLIQIIRSIFLTSEATSRYVLNSLIFNLNLGTLLLPFLVLISYTRSLILIYSVIFIIVIVFIYKLFRGLFVGLSHSKFSIFYLFLYLCTVEILPVIIVVKLLMG